MYDCLQLYEQVLGEIGFLPILDLAKKKKVLNSEIKYIMPSANHHFIVVEAFVCPSYPRGYIVWGVLPTGRVSLKANWS